jgi:hypothetical protein
MLVIEDPIFRDVRRVLVTDSRGNEDRARIATSNGHRVLVADADVVRECDWRVMHFHAPHLRPQDLSGRTLWLWCLLGLGGEP